MEFADCRRRIKTRLKAGFPLGEFVRANREKSNLIGWRQTLTTSPANHIRFLLVRANNFAKWKTGLIPPVVDMLGRNARFICSNVLPYLYPPGVARWNKSFLISATLESTQPLLPCWAGRPSRCPHVDTTCLVVGQMFYCLLETTKNRLVSVKVGLHPSKFL